MTHPVNSIWLSPPDELKLSSGQVDIWQADLNLNDQQLAQFQFTLSEDEQQRAQRFRFERDRHQYIAARGILRSLLGRYLNTHPAQLKFQYSEKGKPGLSTPDLTPTIQFNISHSHFKALYAIAVNRRVGIDLEYIRSLEALSLAQRFFSQRELTQLATTAPQQQQQVFFQLWTGKEAYLKATGEGLLGLEKIEITPEDMQLFSTNNPSEPLSNWTLFSIKNIPNYAAAIAVEGENIELYYWQWQPII